MVIAETAFLGKLHPGGSLDFLERFYACFKIVIMTEMIKALGEGKVNS